MFKEGIVYYVKINNDSYELFNVLKLYEECICVNSILFENDTCYLYFDEAFSWTEFNQGHLDKNIIETQITEKEHLKLFNQLRDIEEECFGGEECYIVNAQRNAFNKFIAKKI